MGTMSGGAAVVEALRREGVTHVFGVIGTALLDLLDALYDADDITYVGVRHEQNAVHMADAYARISGRPGVVLAGQPGPGVTNLVTGVAEAYLAYSPVLVLAGSPTTEQVDTGTFQEIDQQALFTPITKRAWTLPSAHRVPGYLRDAFRVCESGRKGPVVLNIPANLLAEKVDPQFVAPPHYRSTEPAAPTDAALDAASALLAGAHRPVIVAGAGVKWARASARLADLAERLEAPVVASAGHGDVLPGDHPLFLGQMGPRGNTVATGVVRDADVILALGTRLGLNSTLYSTAIVPPSAAIIHVDVDPTAVGRHFPVALGLVADAGAVIDGLAPRVSATAPSGRSGWADAARSARADLLADRARFTGEPGRPLHPMAVYAAVQAVVPRDTIITIDTGTCSLSATDALQTYRPPALLTPLDFGLVGFSFAAGLGAKVAAPDRPVLSVMGDGGFSTTMGEIGTAKDAGLHTTTIVMNNGCWGAEKAYQRDFFSRRYVGADLTNPSFTGIAAAYGVHGVRAETLDEVAAAVRDGLSRPEPSIVEVTVDPDTIDSFRKDAFQDRVTPRT